MAEVAAAAPIHLVWELSHATVTGEQKKKGRERGKEGGREEGSYLSNFYYKFEQSKVQKQEIKNYLLKVRSSG